MSDPVDKKMARVGRFRILAEHGRDGIARIVSASHGDSGQLVTLDILDSGDDEAKRAVIERAELCRVVTDRQIYTITEILAEHDPPLIVREHERGISLGQALEADGPFDPHDAGRLIARLARVLDRCHARRIVHGRLSIELLRQDAPDGPYRIASFGRPLVVVNTAQTHPERLRYTAPEQIAGEIATERSDLYALGLIFYALLAGRPAFGAQDRMLLAAQIGEADMPDLAETAPHVPSGFRDLVNKLTDIDPAKRFRTGNALAEAIERTLGKTKPVALPTHQTTEDVPVANVKSKKTIYWPGRLLLAGSLLLSALAAYYVFQDDQRVQPEPIVLLGPSDGEALPEPSLNEPDEARTRPEDALLPSRAREDWRAIAEEARDQGCTQIEALSDHDGVVLDGLIDDPTRQIELEGRLRAAERVRSVSWTRLTTDSAACRFLARLLPLTVQPERRIVRLQATTTPARIRVGDLLVLDIDMPLAAPVGDNWHVFVGYLTSDGELVHLNRGAHRIEPQEPGNAVRIGEPAKGEWFRLTAPGGIEVAFAILSAKPLEPVLNRIEDPAKAAGHIAEQLAAMESPALLSLVPVTVEND